MQVLKEDIRGRILTVARQQFERKGYSKTSMREVAELAGVGVGNIYKRAVGGFGGGYRGGLEENLTWARSQLGDLGSICIRQISIWNGEMKTAA